MCISLDKNLFLRWSTRERRWFSETFWWENLSSLFFSVFDSLICQWKIWVLRIYLHPFLLHLFFLSLSFLTNLFSYFLYIIYIFFLFPFVLPHFFLFFVFSMIVGKGIRIGMLSDELADRWWRGISRCLRPVYEQGTYFVTIIIITVTLKKI